MTDNNIPSGGEVRNAAGEVLAQVQLTDGRTAWVTTTERQALVESGQVVGGQPRHGTGAPLMVSPEASGLWARAWQRWTLRRALFLLVFSVVLTLIIPLGTYAYLTRDNADATSSAFSGGGEDAEETPPAQEPAPPSDTPPEVLNDNHGLVIGDETAPKSVVIYEDFLCPFCGQLEQAVAARLAEAAEAGTVTVEYRLLGFLERTSDYSPQSANAFAVVLDASGPEVAMEFHDLLFAQQPSEAGPFPDDDALVALAVEAGADEGDVRPGIEGMQFEGWVTAATDAATNNGITSIPSVFINGEIVQAQTLDGMVAAVVAGTD